MSIEPSASPSRAQSAELSSAPVLAEPEKRTEGGVVREVYVPLLAPPVTGGQLGDIPFTNAVEAPDDAVLSRKDSDGGWFHVSSAEFAEDVRSVAKGLIANGLRPGDRVGIMSRTTYEWTLIDFASWAAGLVTVPLYPTSSARQARSILLDSGARACFVENVEHGRLLSGERGNLPELHHLWQVDTGALAQVRDAGREIPDAAVAQRREQVTPDHAATIIYTSGTTGTPKGCVLTHGNFFAEVDNAIELLHPVFRSVSEGPACTVLFLPLSHVFGRMVAIACLRERVRLGHAPSMKADDLLADLASFQPTFLMGIPYVLEKIYNTSRATAEKAGRLSSFDRAARVARRYAEAAQARTDGSGKGPGVGLRTARGVYDTLVYRRIRAALGGKCTQIISGGSPLGRSIGAFFTGAGINIYEGYGLTETTAASTATPPLRPRLGTVGWPMPGTTVRIADDGEVLLSGGQVFTGYWDAERERAQPHRTPEGWFATGDLGALDDEGYLSITGRKKDLIITSGGKNLVPAPLEDWLRAHPLISQCLVVGDNRPYIAALITLDPEGLAHWQRMHRKQHLSTVQLAQDEDLLHNLQQVVNEVNAQVSRAESIRRFQVLPRDFSEEGGYLTPSMKLRRARIVRDYARQIDELYNQPPDSSRDTR